MFGFNDSVAQGMYSTAPQSFKALQNLVMAMDDFQKKAGKKTLFGKDKSQELLVMVTVNIGRTITAMRADGIISPKSSAEEVHRLAKAQLDRFFEAFPMWTMAMVFSEIFFSDQMSIDVVKTHVEMYPDGFQY